MLTYLLRAAGRQQPEPAPLPRRGIDAEMVVEPHHRVDCIAGVAGIDDEKDLMGAGGRDFAGDFNGVDPSAGNVAAVVGQ
jgi:hypothetical protein